MFPPAEIGTAGPASGRGAIPALCWYSLGLALLLTVASSFLAGPQVQADEGSYLLNAAMLAGRIHANPSYGYYSGYSLLLLPAFLLSSQPGPIYHSALLINALLVASTPFALYRLTRDLWPAITERAHVVSALVATCHAQVLILSQYTMSESALVALYAWLLASGMALLKRERTRSALAFGAIAGLLFLVHPRGAIIAAPALLFSSIYAISSGRCRQLIAIAWVLAIAVAALHVPLELRAGFEPNGAGGYSLGLILSRLANPAAWSWLLFNLIGATTEALVASLGMFAFGVRAVATEFRSHWRRGTERYAPEVAILLSCLAGMAIALLVTAAFFAPPQRADQLSYGRYALPTLVPLLAIGLIRLPLGRAQRVRDMTWAVAAGLTGIAITAAAFTQLPATAKTNWNFVNSPVLTLARRLVPWIDAWAAIALCFILGTLVLRWCLQHSQRRAVAVYLGLNIATAAFGSLATTLPGSRYYASERRIVDLVHALATASDGRLCITFGPGVDAWHRPDLGWRLFPYAGRQTNHEPCLHGTIVPMTAAKPAPHMRLVAVERPSPLGKKIPIGLLMERGPKLDEFVKAHGLPETHP
jgi:hypothetical protein